MNSSAETIVDARAAIAEEFAALGLEPAAQPAALCLSGGGIRSAAFCLGVIQALAAAGLLKRFHYLSTVSGGGYIGGWLTRLIGSLNDGVLQPVPPVHLATIERTLTERANGIECDELSALRRYTNYLTPKLGPASADLWAGVLLWIRNTLINWLVFTPLLVGLVSLPILYALLVALVADPQHGHPLLAGSAAAAAGVAGLGCLGLCIFRSILYLPTHIHPGRAWSLTRKDEFGLTDREVLRKIVAPALLWCLLAPVAATPLMLSPRAGSDIEAVFASEPPARRWTGATFKAEVGDRVQVSVVVGGAPKTSHATSTIDSARNPLTLWLLVVAIFLTAMIAYFRGIDVILGYDYGKNPENRQRQVAPFATNMIAWVASCAASAGLNGLGVHLGTGAGLLWIVVVGPLWVLVAEILRSTLYIAFRREALRGDLDREWLARLNGTKLSVVLVGVAGGIIVLLAPRYVPAGLESWSAILGGGAASGTAAALLGKSARTALAARKPDGSRWIGLGPIIAAAIVVFATALLLVTGRGVGAAMWGLSGAIVEKTTDFAPRSNAFLDARTLLAFVLTAIVASGSVWLALKLGRWINLNNFSMHAVYRNRLVRAFLGTARPKGDWRPDRYAHFDPHDDIRMADAFDRREPRGLFPVVNVALNCTSGKDMARAERKAESFTITPLRCGSASLRGPADDRKGDTPPHGAYAKSEDYAGKERETGPGDAEKGISLGTAITISGAAASPNMGYHSSPLIAFVMTLFNVRLGAWLPNPGAGLTDPGYLSNADADSIRPMLDELAGRSDDAGKYVYLSDGGHFDNLALYEMLRRRCMFIVVVDAGQDGSYAYSDLRMVIQRASVDLGVDIKFLETLHIGRTTLNPLGALATVRYPTVAGSPAGGADATPASPDHDTGTILYLKPWLPEDCPTELRAFRAARASFPHENTGNQFFTESDFESYRRLGHYLAGTILDAAKARSTKLDTISDLFVALEDIAKDPRSPTEATLARQQVGAIKDQLTIITQVLNRRA